MQKRHKLDEKTKAKRLARARLITGFYISWEQKQLRFGLLPPSVVWSDEKVFAVEEKFNQQNDRIYCVTVQDIPDDLRYAERQQSPASIMVWACGLATMPEVDFRQSERQMADTLNDFSDMTVDN